jgi:hypothetical protein
MPERTFGDGPESRPGGRPLAEDALRLVSSLQDWAQGWAERPRGEAAGSANGSDCQWCPLCQFVAVVRGERPELTERIADAGAALATALRAVADAAAGASGPSGPRRESPPPAPRVQKINLGDRA